MSGRLERQLAIPLWDGSRPAWVSESFKLLDSGHFWIDLKLGLSADLILGPAFKGLVSLEVEGDFMINVKPRLLSDNGSCYISGELAE